MKVLPVGGRRLRAAFIELPWRIYSDDPHWVPPLRSEMRRQMSTRLNPFWKHAEAAHFVAFSDVGEPVGRVAATVYPEYNRRFGTRTGFFGFFECVRDDEVARALLGTCESWARARGLTHLAGPYNYCATQEMGLLVEGFDTPPTLFQTHNPSYYPGLLRECGYRTEFSLTTYSARAKDLATPRLLERGDAIKRAQGLTVRPLDMRRYDEELELLRSLFNDSFAGNDDVLPVEREVFAAQAAALRRFVDPRLVQFLEEAGRPVAFVLTLPNLNELLPRLDGRVSLWAILTLGRSLRAIRSVVIALMGALPRFRGTGIMRTLYAEMARSVAEAGYEFVHTTWVHEDNAATRGIVRRCGAAAPKRYVILGRELAAASGSAGG